MAGTLSPAGKAAALNGLAAVATYASLHSGAPGTTGANELTGGAPAYARKAHTWNTTTNDALDNSNTPTFDVPAGVTVAYVGMWTAATAGTFLGFYDVTDESFTAQGTYQLLDADINVIDV